MYFDSPSQVYDDFGADEPASYPFVSSPVTDVGCGPASYFAAGAGTSAMLMYTGTSTCDGNCAKRKPVTCAAGASECSKVTDGRVSASSKFIYKADATCEEPAVVTGEEAKEKMK